MITRNTARDLFMSRLASSTLPSNPKEGFATLFAFQRACPVTGGIDDQQDGDMMLFQYGTYDWGDGPHFELNLTRQVMFADPPENEDPEIWQLGLTYRYAPQPELDALGRHDTWLDDLMAGETAVMSDPAVATATSRAPTSVTLNWEQT